MSPTRRISVPPRNDPITMPTRSLPDRADLSERDIPPLDDITNIARHNDDSCSQLRIFNMLHST
jgi:hypothetical protein